MIGTLAAGQRRGERAETNAEPADCKLHISLIATGQRAATRCGKHISPHESASLDHPSDSAYNFRWRRLLIYPKSLQPHLKEEGGKVEEGNKKHHRPREESLRMSDE